MNYREKCPHCGRIVAAYSVQMNEGLIRAFITFSDARLRLARPVMKHEMTLDHSQYGNFQKLRYFELIYQLENRLEGWEMTPLGWSFFRGEIMILNPAGHIAGQRLADNHSAWSSHKGGRKLIGILDVLPDEYRKRPEFSAEKAGVE